MDREALESTGRLTREQRLILARLDCATDRFILACRLERKPDGGIMATLLKNAPMLRAGMMVVHPFLPKPLRILSWLLRTLP